MLNNDRAIIQNILLTFIYTKERVITFPLLFQILLFHYAILPPLLFSMYVCVYIYFRDRETVKQDVK